VKRKDAAHFSFLLSIPAILAANLKEFNVLMNLDTGVIPQYIAGFIASFISGYLVIAILIRLIQGGNLKYFAYYVWFVGLAAIGYLLLI
jgi:undecaprenyl-diphosphatase